MKRRARRMKPKPRPPNTDFHVRPRDNRSQARRATRAGCAPAAVRQNQNQGGRPRGRGAEDDARLAGQAAADHDAPGLPSRRARGAALLLSPEAPHRRQLPHVPRRVRHAAVGTGPQARAQRGRHVEDCEVRAALRADHAAWSHRVRHAHFAGHGDLPEFSRDEADARGGAGIAPYQSPARLPHL